MPIMETSNIPEHDFQARYGQLMEEVQAYRSALAVLRRNPPRQSNLEYAAQIGDTDH